MASLSTKNLTAAIRSPFMKRHGLKPDVADTATTDYKWDNNFALKASTATDGDGPTYEKELLRLDADDIVQVGGAAFKGNTQSVSFKVATSASLVDQVFWICPYTDGVRVTKIDCIYETANGAAFTAKVSKIPDTLAMAGATSLHSGSTSFDLNTTTKTLQTATLAPECGIVDLDYKDRLMVDFTGSLTSMAGLCITVTFTPGNKGETATYAMMANGDMNDQDFFIASRPMKVSKILAAFSTKSTGATNIQVEKCTGTTAAGAGTVLLTNDTDAGFETDGTVNTAQVGALSVTASELRLAWTDRLAVDFNGTLTGLAGVVITVLFEPTYNRREVVYALDKNANLVDQVFFIADRDYEVIAAHCSWGVASSSGNAQVTIDKAADATGAGTDLISDDTNAGFAIDGTANTVAVGGLKAALGTPYNVLLAGDRLSVDYSATTSLRDVVIVVSLKPC